ncbi:hypothetical protein [Saccharothrix australiensis]|uniref:hypothetical protein n=1 Tax=Saccharothrix australiensis TaxID=2072 RepID=UPI000EB4156F|nr:hypothetical protein [Saccharothrix australiensis]
MRAYAATTAHDHLPGGVRRAALDRVVDHCRHTADAADRLMNPTPRHPRSLAALTGPNPTTEPP